MKKAEIDRTEWEFSEEYKKECAHCEEEHIVYTQKDDYPEYYTQVSIVCSCDGIVTFELPVN